MNRDTASPLVSAHRRQQRRCVDVVLLRALVNDACLVLGEGHEAGRDHVLPRVGDKWCETGNRSPSIGDFEGFTLCDPVEVLARVLTQLSYSDAVHGATK